MPVWKLVCLRQQLKKQLIKSLVWSVVLYVAENWTLKSSDEKKIKDVGVVQTSTCKLD